jgi:peptidoglycan/LPS O-acetylase OafA/YrhL
MRTQRPATAQSKTERFRFLDGLRGWAAVVVLLHHVFIDGLPANGLMADRILWAKVFFLNGTLAVCVFFVISGFSLSIRYLDGGHGGALARIASGRYLRLALPILAICAITHALLLLGAIPPAAQRPPPLDALLTFAPTLQHLLSFSLLKVFVAYSGAETYDPPLWTMSYELYGSFLVFAVVALLRRSQLRTLMLGVLFVALAALQSFLTLFVAGILIADLFLRGPRPAAANLTGAALCVAGLLLILLPSTWFGPVYIGGATCLTAGAVFNMPVRRFFESRLSGFLGWISFPLYLVQAAVIYALAPRGLALMASLELTPEMQRWIVGVAMLPIAVLCALAFCPINDAAVALSRRFGAGFVALCDDIRRRLARQNHPQALIP